MLSADDGPSASRPSRPHGPGWLRDVRTVAILLAMVFAFQTLLFKFFYIPSDSMVPTLMHGDRLVVSKFPYGWSHASVGFRLLPPMPGRLFGRTPARGDIVILEHPVTRADYIKRVIGLPGDTVSMRGGALMINGQPVVRAIEPPRRVPVDGNMRCTGGAMVGYLLVATPGGMACDLSIVRETLPGGATFDTVDGGPGRLFDDFGPVQVPNDHLWLMGDSRDNSADSRASVADRGLGGPVPMAMIGGRAELVTFSMDGSARWYDPLSWFRAMRAGRFGLSLRPDSDGAQRMQQGKAFGE